MGRPGRVLDPSEGPLAAFCHDLAQLRAAAALTLRELEKRSGYSKAALSKAASGVSLPSFDLTMAYVGACRGDTTAWEKRWKELDALLRATHPELIDTPAPPDSADVTSAAPRESGTQQPANPGVAVDTIVLGRATAPLGQSDPRRAGDYRLVARLGSGAMGQVFLGVSKAGRPVAVKVIRPDLADDPQFRRRFAAEIRAARTVQGPYTPALVDADTDAPRPWLATTYIPGPSLAEVVEATGPLSTPVVRGLAAGIAEALAAIHAAGVLHRDLKPANVLIDRDGPKVIDFGIARAAEGGETLTRTGVWLGTVPFMSPEQLTGETVGPATDIFSLGCLLCYAATGTTPFGEGSAGEVVYRIAHNAPDPATLPSGDHRLRQLIQRCLDKDPTRRPTPAHIIDTCATGSATWLPTALATGVAEREAEVGRLLTGNGRRRPATIATVSAISLVLVIGIVIAAVLATSHGDGSRPNTLGTGGGTVTQGTSQAGHGGAAAAAGSRFHAQAGPACADTPTSNGTQYADPSGDGWHQAALSGRTGCGPFFLYSHVANSNDPTQWQDDYDWTFAPVPHASRCTLSIYVPATGHPLATDAYYWVNDTGHFGDAGKGIAEFTLDQAANRGRWVTEGPFTIAHGVIGVEPTDRGAGADTVVVAAPLRVTC